MGSNRYLGGGGEGLGSSGGHGSTEGVREGCLEQVRPSWVLNDEWEIKRQRE